jgi:hypothetical protein
MDLYSLNKDMLVKLVATIRDDMSNKEMKKILEDRRKIKKMKIVKNSLIDLKIIPHLKDLIEKHEEIINNITDLNEFLETSNQFLNVKVFIDDSESIHTSIKIFNLSHSCEYSTWLNKYDKVYNRCNYCGGISLSSYYEKQLRMKKRITCYFCKECI